MTSGNMVKRGTLDEIKQGNEAKCLEFDQFKL